MSYKFRVACPAFILLLAVAAFCFFGTSTSASSTEEKEIVAGTVKMTVEPLSPSAVDEAYIVALSNSAGMNEDGYYETSGSGYVLSEADRIAVECAVMCEAGGEGERGQMMIAQCILDGCLRSGITPSEMIYYYRVASVAHYRVTDEVKESVSKVFDDGLRITKAKADLWYNPAVTESSWHEDQTYITTVGYHRFFWANRDVV